MFFSFVVVVFFFPKRFALSEIVRVIFTSVYQVSDSTPNQPHALFRRVHLTLSTLHTSSLATIAKNARYGNKIIAVSELLRLKVTKVNLYRFLFLLEH